MEKNIKARKRGFSVLSLLILLLLLLYVVSLLVPLGWALMTSLKGKLDYIDNPFGLPKKWLFSNYKTAAEYYASQIIDKNGPRMVQIGEMLVNSLLFAVRFVVSGDAGYLRDGLCFVSFRLQMRKTHLRHRDRDYGSAHRRKPAF